MNKARKLTSVYITFFHRQNKDYAICTITYCFRFILFSIKENLVTGGKNWIALFLNKVVNNPVNGTVRINVTNYLSKEVFEFNIANKGSSSILHYSPSLAEPKNKGIYMSPKYVNYNADDVTVTIADINATHVSGTFSGKFIEQGGKAVINITDGKFDLPFIDDKTNQ